MCNYRFNKWDEHKQKKGSCASVLKPVMEIEQRRIEHFQCKEQ